MFLRVLLHLISIVLVATFTVLDIWQTSFNQFNGLLVLSLAAFGVIIGIKREIPWSLFPVLILYFAMVFFHLTGVRLPMTLGETELSLVITFISLIWVTNEARNLAEGR